MKTKLFTTLFFLITLFISEVWGQTNIHVQGASFIDSYTINSSSREDKAQIKGSPFYNKDFMFGELELVDGNTVKGLFRYNIYAQELEVIVKKDTLIITDPTKIKNFDFSGKQFIYSLILEDRKKTDFISGAYFESVNNGECKLLIKRRINLRENTFTDYYGGGGGDGSQRYIPELTYYIKKSDDKPAIKLKKNKKFILNYFEDYKNEISDYISSQNLNTRNEQDIIKIIEYYNQLKNS